jgi:hypothetical protein
MLSLAKLGDNVVTGEKYWLVALTPATVTGVKMLREVHLEAGEMLTSICENSTRHCTAITVVNFKGAIRLLRRLGFRLVILVLAIANITGAVSGGNPEIRRTG